MAADVLATQGARASAAMMMIQFWNSPALALRPAGLRITLHAEKLNVLNMIRSDMRVVMIVNMYIPYIYR